MSYTLSIPLKNKNNISSLIKSFNFPYKEYSNFINISSNMNEHSYPEALENGIFLSYKVLPQDVSYYVSFFANNVAIKNGLEKICEINKKSYPYYYYDSRIVYVIPKIDLQEFNKDLMYEYFDIKVNEEIENINIHSHVNRKNLNITDKEFNDLFGDNELLKNNCSKLLKRLTKKVS